MNTGSLFSRSAFTPSLWSSVFRQMLCAVASKSNSVVTSIWRPLYSNSLIMAMAMGGFLASLPAKLEIESEINATNEEAGIYQVDITVRNTGFLRTALQHAETIDVVDPVILEVTPDSNLEILFGEERVRLDHINGNSKSDKIPYVLRKKNAAAGAILKTSVKAQRANNDAKEISIP